jgi:hypothetical protein
MDKKEEFKSFISNHPELVEYVRKKEMTWQEFYEIYDIYGEDETTWNKYFSNDRDIITDKVGELTKMFKNINFDNLQKYITNAEKAIGIIQELTAKTPDTTPIVDTNNITFYDN